MIRYDQRISNDLISFFINASHGPVTGFTKVQNNSGALHKYCLRILAQEEGGVRSWTWEGMAFCFMVAHGFLMFTTCYLSPYLLDFD
jgi:hypothetical protein